MRDTVVYRRSAEQICTDCLETVVISFSCESLSCASSGCFSREKYTVYLIWKSWHLLFMDRKFYDHLNLRTSLIFKNLRSFFSYLISKIIDRYRHKFYISQRKNILDNKCSNPDNLLRCTCVFECFQVETSIFLEYKYICNLEQKNF